MSKNKITKKQQSIENYDSDDNYSDDSSNDSDDGIVGQRGRPFGSKKNGSHGYKHEYVILKLDKILGLYDNKRSFCVEDINENQVNEIIEFGKFIKTCYSCGKWAFYRTAKGKYPFLSLIKSVYKNTSYDVVQNNIKVIENGNLITKIHMTITKKT